MIQDKSRFRDSRGRHPLCMRSPSPPFLLPVLLPIALKEGAGEAWRGGAAGGFRAFASAAIAQMHPAALVGRDRQGFRADELPPQAGFLGVAVVLPAEIAAIVARVEIKIRFAEKTTEAPYGIFERPEAGIRHRHQPQAGIDDAQAFEHFGVASFPAIPARGEDRAGRSGQYGDFCITPRKGSIQNYATAIRCDSSFFLSAR